MIHLSENLDWCESVSLFHLSGLSSTVRRCVLRESGQEFAVKIIEKSQDSSILKCIQAEVDILTDLPSHSHISES